MNGIAVNDMILQNLISLVQMSNKNTAHNFTFSFGSVSPCFTGLLIAVISIETA